MMYDTSLATIAIVFQNLHHFVLSLPNPEPFSRFTPLEIDNLPCNANSLQVFSSKSQKLDNVIYIRPLGFWMPPWIVDAQ